MDIEEILKNINSTLGTVAPVTATTPEQDADRKRQYEAEQADRKAVLRGLRNEMLAECERFNATYKLQPDTTPEPEPDDTNTPQPLQTSQTTQNLVSRRETLRLSEIEWGVLQTHAEYNMHSVAQYISVIVRRHLQRDVETILRSSTKAQKPKRPVGRPPADRLRAPMYLQPWTPAIWEDETESWHAQAAVRNPTHSPAEVRVAHNLYLETLFAHLQRVGFPHPFKAGFTAI
jgi:hypothetical protein